MRRNSCLYCCSFQATPESVRIMRWLKLEEKPKSWWLKIPETKFGVTRRVENSRRLFQKKKKRNYKSQSISNLWLPSELLRHKGDSMTPTKHNCQRLKKLSKELRCALHSRGRVESKSRLVKGIGNKLGISMEIPE